MAGTFVQSDCRPNCCRRTVSSAGSRRLTPDGGCPDAGGAASINIPEDTYHSRGHFSNGDLRRGGSAPTGHFRANCVSARDALKFYLAGAELGPCEIRRAMANTFIRTNPSPPPAKLARQGSQKDSWSRSTTCAPHRKPTEGANTTAVRRCLHGPTFAAGSVSRYGRRFPAGLISPHNSPALYAARGHSSIQPRRRGHRANIDPTYAMAITLRRWMGRGFFFSLHR